MDHELYRLLTQIHYELALIRSHLSSEDGATDEESGQDDTGKRPTFQATN